MRILGNIVRLFTKKLSFKEVLIWLAVIFGLGSLLFYWALCNVIREGSAAEDLFTAAGEISQDLQEHGECDLREVRKHFSSKYQVPLLWTKVVIISDDKKYDGSVICCVPRSYFGKLAMGTVGVLLRRDRYRAGYTTMISGIEGSPHFIREKGAAP